MNQKVNRMRPVLLGLIVLDMSMVIISMVLYPPLVTMPHFYLYVLELGIMFPVYIVIVLFATRSSIDLAMLRTITFFGTLAAVIEIIHISIENFGQLRSHAETVSTGIFMGVLFLLFAVSGFQITQKKRNSGLGVMGASLSAVVCMLIVMTFGLSQLFWAFGAIEAHDIGDPDFIRTGWKDLHAFAIADIFEVCFKILFIGPIAGIMFGLLGSTIARLFVTRRLK